MQLFLTFWGWQTVKLSVTLHRHLFIRMHSKILTIKVKSALQPPFRRTMALKSSRLESIRPKRVSLSQTKSPLISRTRKSAMLSSRLYAQLTDQSVAKLSHPGRVNKNAQYHSIIRSTVLGSSPAPRQQSSRRYLTIAGPSLYHIRIEFKISNAGKTRPRNQKFIRHIIIL